MHFLFYFHAFLLNQLLTELVVVFIDPVPNLLRFLPRLLNLLPRTGFFLLEHAHPVLQLEHVLLDLETDRACLGEGEVFALQVNHLLLVHHI